MKKIFLTLIILLYSIVGNSASSYHSIHIIKTDNSSISYPLSWVDSVVSTTQTQTLFLSVPTSEIKEIIYPYTTAINELNLNEPDKKSFFNQLFSVTLKQSKNPLLQCDYTIRFNGDSATLILPYITDFTTLTLDFNSFGTYLLVNGQQYNNGNTTINCSQPIEIKVISFAGDIHTYYLTITNSSKSIVTLQSVNNEKEEITTDWKDSFLVVTSDPGGNANAIGLAEFRGRGKNYAENRKNTYGIKLEEKSKIFGMPKGKRWILLPNDNDKTLLRSPFAFYVYKNYLGTCWTPNYTSCELILNNEYKGSYLLAEQIRITDERISSGIILSIEKNVDDDDDYFISKKSKSFFVFQDPNAGTIDTRMIRTQVTIDEFESLLYSDNEGDKLLAKEKINSQSFIDWILLNEIAKNENAFVEDCYINISTENIISMGPIWDMSKLFGLYSDDSHEGFAVINQSWAQQLAEDMTFYQALYQRFQSIYNQKESLLTWIDEEAILTCPSAYGNEQLHNVLGGKQEDYSTFSKMYMNEVERLKTWIINRLEWMNLSLQK